MLSYIISTSTDWVTAGTVRPQDGGVGVKTLKVSASTARSLLVCSVEDVVDLVCSVLDIAPEKGCLDSLTSLRVNVETSSLGVNVAGVGASATQNSSGDHSTLRVTVDNDQGIRALGVVLGDLPDAVDGTFLDGRAELHAESGIEDDIHVVARVALGLKFCADGISETRGTAIAVRCVVTAGHKESDIVTSRGELGRCGALGTGGQWKSCKNSSGEALLHDGRGRHIEVRE